MSAEQTSHGDEEATPLGLFEGYGIEIEYMIVNPDSLDVLPLAPTVLQSLQAQEGTVELGAVAWSNELAAHVIELKTNGPVKDLARAATAFRPAINQMNEHLKAFGAQLLPSGMHPWMNPDKEFVLYPVDDEGFYGTFDRIFDCRGHGWSNLQSMHVNLPFSGDEELAELHSAIRFLLPVLPALAASSPFEEGVRTPQLDHRLFVYRDNAASVPSVSGRVVPEHVESRQDYERHILEPIYAALSSLDPEGVLRYEWVNARGCIARFDRMALEIRVLDAQECTRADLAIAFAVCETLRQWVSERRFRAASAEWTDARLAATLWEVATRGSDTPVSDAEYLRALGTPTLRTAGEVWNHLLENLPPAARQGALYEDAAWLVENGCLAQRIVQATGDTPSRETLRGVYRRLAGCLQDNEFFVA